MPEEYVPPVVAVVVSTASAAGLDQCLESLAAQDYPSLDVLVVDTGTGDDLTTQVAKFLPGGFVRRRPDATGFAAAANEVLSGIEGASFFLFCHDDVALAPSAVRLMVEEAFRSNAGIVGPKLLDWETPDRILQIGLGMSRFGSPVARIEEGELDQAQHDEVREVFAVPSACMLARVDLFAAIGGFDSEIGAYGEDVDLCWRAQLAAARVVIAPRAVARHRQSTAAGERPIGNETAIRRRNELRSVLKNYGLLRRLTVALELAILVVLDSVAAPLTGRRDRARAARSAWRWNIDHRRSLREARQVVHDVRQVSDRPLVSRMARRSYLHRLTDPQNQGDGSAVRHHRGAPSGRVTAGPGAGPHVQRDDRAREVDKLTALYERARSGEMKSGRAVVAILISLLVLVGVRGLLFGHLPVIGDLVVAPSALHLLGQWVGGRSDPGWGPAQVSPSAYGLIGLVGIVLGDSSAVALKFALLSGIVVGSIGTWRLLDAFGSHRAQLVGVVVFVSSPLLWNGLGTGDIESSVALAGLPFVLRRLARSSGLEPFGRPGGAPGGGWGPRDLIAEIAPLGLLLAAMIALSPPVVLDVGVVAVMSLVASAAVGGWRAMLRAVSVGSAGVVVAFACCLPWSVTWFQSGARWSLFSGSVSSAGSALSPADLLRGHTGAIGGFWGVAGLVGFAAFGFLWARGPRLAWVTRWWLCALGSVLLAWIAGEGWLGAGGGRVEVLVAPAAVAFAACCGIGTAAFESDLRRHRFGWRQITGVLAALCLALGVVPALGALLGGRAGMPGIGFEEASAEFTTPFPPGARVLWIGNPLALPGTAFQAAKGLAAFVTTAGLPTVATLWPAANPGPAGGVSEDVVSAMAGRTLRLGALVAPAGIRYIVVPTAGAPALIGEQAPVPALPPRGLVTGLEAQTDLRQLPNDDGMLVWANARWTPQDGLGTLSGPGSASLGGFALVGVAAGLLVICSCIVEGVLRRRRPRPRRASVAAAGGTATARAVADVARLANAEPTEPASAEPASAEAPEAPAEPASAEVPEAPAEPAQIPAPSSPRHHRLRKRLRDAT
jgi:GT2 family glycosyltransferase